MKTIELYLRVSDYRAWLDCRRKFYLTKVYGIQEDTDLTRVRPPGNADIGSIVDHGLNALFNDQGRVDLWGAHNVPVGAVNSQWAKEWGNAVELSSIMLDGFEEWWAEQEESATLETRGIQVEVEHRFGPFYVGPGRSYEVYVTLIGHIDYEAYDHKFNTLAANDFKTVATLGQHLKQVDVQMNIYALLLAYSRNEHVGIARHIQLRRVKRTARATPPFYGKRTIVINHAQLARAEILLIHALRDMVQLYPWNAEHADDARYYPSPTGECNWKCNVKSLCDMMDDGSDWDSIAVNAYNLSEEAPVLLRPRFQLDKEEV